MKKPLPTSVGQLRDAVADPARLKAMQETGLMEAPANPVFDELTRTASQLLGTPVAMLTLVDTQRDFVMSHYGLPEPLATAREINLQPSFCELTAAQAETVVINDTLADSLYRMYPSVEAMGVRAHLGVPLFYKGKVIGNCCVIDFVPREWTAEDIENLERLAESAMEYIRSRDVPDLASRA